MDRDAAMAPGSVARGLLVLLAGGRSSRFGAPKSSLRLNGEAILDWQRRCLTEALRAALRRPVQAWLSLPPIPRDQAASDPPGAERYDRVVRDDLAFAGPLAGLRAALAAANDRDAILLATVDMPVIGVDQVRRLVKAAGANSTSPTSPATQRSHATLDPAAHDDAATDGAHGAACIGVMWRWADGPDAGVVEPFPSLWQVGAARTAITTLLAAQGDDVGPKALASLAGVRCLPLHHDRDRAAWSNINRPQDITQVEAALGVRIGADG